MSEPADEGLTVLLVGISELDSATYAERLTGMTTLRALSASSGVARMSIFLPFAVVVGKDLTGEERSKVRLAARALTVYAISDFGGPTAVARHLFLLAERRRDRVPDRLDLSSSSRDASALTSRAALLTTVRAQAAAGNYVLSNEAVDRARAAGHSPADVRHALSNARQCIDAGGGRWTVVGPSLDGTDMQVVVLMAADGRDVTVV